MASDSHTEGSRSASEQIYTSCQKLEENRRPAKDGQHGLQQKLHPRRRGAHLLNDVKVSPDTEPKSK